MTLPRADARTVIVTGAASGIGRETALAFASEGAHVACWDRLEDDGSLRRQLTACGREPLVETVDVTVSRDVDGAVARVLSRWGRVDVLVNNAGIVRDAQLVKWTGDEVASVMSDEAFDAVLDVNVKGVFHCTRAVAPSMIAARQGVVLNASSVVALYGNFGQTNYVATKSAVVGLTRTWARELGRYGIRVNAVAPGFIATDMLKTMPAQVVAGMVARTPLGRAGTPRDVANAYVWLASERASFVHGAVLSVDGGLVVGT
ncbi:MAG: SDR family oxidoreductase [Vicinamibacterales bacterium]